MFALSLFALEERMDSLAGIKLLAAGLPLVESNGHGIRPSNLTWKSVEDLVHLVVEMHGSVLSTRCMFRSVHLPGLLGHVYPGRFTSYLDRELGFMWLQPVTCLWCATNQWRP